MDQVDKPDGMLYRRPWELTSQTLEGFRQDASTHMPSWTPPVPFIADAHAMVPPRFGWRTDELTIDDILNGVFTKLDDPANVGYFDDFSGQNGGYGGTERYTHGEIPQGL